MNEESINTILMNTEKNILWICSLNFHYINASNVAYIGKYIEFRDFPHSSIPLENVRSIKCSISLIWMYNLFV